MLDNSLFEVTRGDYTSILHHFKSEARKVEETRMPDDSIFTIVYSKVRGIKICGRRSWIDKPEKYYIWELLKPEESQPYDPPLQVELTDPKQVQAVLDYFAKKRKEEEANG